MSNKTLNLHHLPYRESMTKGKDKGGWGMYYRRRGSYKKIGDYSIYKIITRILEEFLGKPVDEAFSKYCKIVEPHQQKFFWERLSCERNWYYYRHYVDTQGNIAEFLEEPQPKTYKVNSWDIKFGHLHPVTLKPLDYFWGVKYVWGPIKGQIYTHHNKDYKYFRDFYEQRAKKRASDRALALLNKEHLSTLNFTTKADIEKKKASALRHRQRIFIFQMSSPTSNYTLQLLAYQALLEIESED